MLEFAFPYAFLALPLPLLVIWLLPPHQERVSALRVPFFDAVAEAAGADPQAGAVFRVSAQGDVERWIEAG